LRVLGRDSRPVVLGHRGGRGVGWPAENTLAAFRQARAQGAHGVELDVRLCASGEVVVLHDRTLARVTRGQDQREVAAVPFRELRELMLDGSSESVPKLADVLAWSIESATPLNVEVKHDVPHRLALVCAVAREVIRANTEVLLSSFDPVTLLALRALAPAIPCALLTDPSQSYQRALFQIARRPLVSALHVERSQVTKGRLLRWKRRGTIVGAWTVNDPSEAVRLAALGVDILITDEPGQVLKALESIYGQSTASGAIPSGTG
jgi:glycerophosphoryl diester phosphodiesterase